MFGKHFPEIIQISFFSISGTTKDSQVKLPINIEITNNKRHGLPNKHQPGLQHGLLSFGPTEIFDTEELPIFSFS